MNNNATLASITTDNDVEFQFLLQNQITGANSKVFAKYCPVEDHGSKFVLFDVLVKRHFSESQKGQEWGWGMTF